MEWFLFRVTLLLRHFFQIFQRHFTPWETQFHTRSCVGWIKMSMNLIFSMYKRTFEYNISYKLYTSCISIVYSQSFHLYNTWITPRWPNNGCFTINFPHNLCFNNWLSIYNWYCCMLGNRLAGMLFLLNFIFFIRQLYP